jgi:hypothetical protein
MNEPYIVNALYDHYKDTYTSIRERERERDKLFLLLIGIFALLALQVVYPLQFGGVVETITLGNTKLSLGAASAAALLTSTWLLLSAIALRYGQRVVWVERQYDYLHILEKRVGRLLNEESIFGREGAAYLKGAPFFQDWTWLLYVLLFPIVGISVASILLIVEWIYLDYPAAHLVLDTTAAVTLTVTLYVYRLHPLRDIVARLKSVSRRPLQD